jgi:hypothetical protein
MPPAPPPGERGATRVSGSVVAKLAAQAAREALDGRPAAALVPHRPDGPPHATAVVRRPPGADGTPGLAAVSVAVELGYPSDIGAQCGAVRHRVAERIRELAGLDAAEVTVAVRRLYSAGLGADGGRGRVR